jgi:hypothetical protein
VPQWLTILRESEVHKIAVYGFGSQPVVHRHLIDLATKQKSPLKWCAILPSPYYRALINEVLPADEILDVFRVLPRVPQGGDPECLSHYPGSLAEDLAAQKWYRRKRPGRWLLNRGIDYYRLYKSFLADRGATHILMSVVETPDAKIALAAAQELGLGVIAPTDMRNMTGTYFAVDCYETPPAYAIANPESRAQAAKFVQSFRCNPTPARAIPTEIASTGQNATLRGYLPSLAQRALRLVKDAIERPDLFDPDQLRVAFMNNLTPIRDMVRKIRRYRNLAQYDVTEVAALPHRYIFYPLQYSPESSINTPAPFFLDQIRVIDALRFAMPSHYTLVVKEHPVCLDMRKPQFMKRLRRLPGVIVMRALIPSIEVIKHASLTVTVTGSSALEAFLLGRPALALGPGVSAWAIGGTATLSSLRNQILDAMNRPMLDDLVIDQVAKLVSVRYPFLFDTPHIPGEPMLQLHNIQQFLSALIDHLKRERSLATAGRSIA